MANTLINSDIITKETLRIIHNESAFLGNVNTDFSDDFTRDSAKAGDTINVRRPVQHTVRDGATASLQDINETKVPIKFEPEFGIDWAFSDKHLTLDIAEFSDRYLKPAGKRLAAEVDLRIGRRLYWGVPSFSGTPGTVPSTAQSVLDAAVYLDNNGAPRDGNRVMAIDPITNSKLVGGMAGLFNDQATQGRQIKSGLIKTNIGMDFQMSQNLPSHLVGPLGGTPLVNGAGQATSGTATENPYTATQSLVTDGWTAAAAARLRKGDVFSIAGVNSVNLETKQDTGMLQQFVVMQDVSSDASGNATITIYPAIITTGGYQNCTNAAADNAAITVRTGTASTRYKQNILYHRDAFAFVTADLELPKGTDMASRASHDGVSLRFVRDFDIINNRRICRFDILAGYGLLRPEWAVRVTN